MKIFNSTNSGEYAALLKSKGLELDIYYSAGFLETEAALHKGEYEIFVEDNGSNIFIYPYILLPLQGSFQGLFDISSPYGYCGPYCDNALFFQKSEQYFLEYIRSRNVVSEFIRYHYLYNQELRFNTDTVNIFNREIVLLDLTRPWEEIWTTDMSSTNRNLVRKLEKEGYSVEIEFSPKHLDEFITMYNETMKNAGAQEFYYFPDEMYHRLFTLLGDKIFMARVVKEGTTYCSALFFESAGILTYYLSARNLNASKVPATNYLLAAVSRMAQQRGCRLVNFGGGRTAHPGDALLKFKSNFSGTRGGFYIGKRMHKMDVYTDLVNNYIREKGEDEYLKVKHLLHFYRS